MSLTPKIETRSAYNFRYSFIHLATMIRKSLPSIIIVVVNSKISTLELRVIDAYCAIQRVLRPMVVVVL